MKRLWFLLLIILPITADTLRVSVHSFPPCVILDGPKKPTGFDIDVFEAVIEKTGHQVIYNYQDKFLDLLGNLEKDLSDISVAGITITGKRENTIDFTHPYLNSGLSICVNKGTKTNPFGILIRYINSMSSMLLLILIFTIFCGIIIFFVEKMFAKKESMFNPDSPANGIFLGFYFANIFSSTVGFGDLVPKSKVGRCLTIIMIFIGVYFIFPYSVANMSMALQQENEILKINDVDDLVGKTVAAKKGTTSETFIRNLGCNVKSVQEIDKAYTLLKENKVDAIVYDMPVLKYFVQNKGKKYFQISGKIFDKQSYGFALQQDSPYREELNKHLADFMRTEEYWELHNKWFGD